MASKKKTESSSITVRVIASCFENVLGVIRTKKDISGKELSSDKEVIDEVSRMLTNMLNTIYEMQRCTVENA